MSAGTQCPQCAQTLGFWTTFGAPIQPIRCPNCKSYLSYVGTGMLTTLFFVVWIVIVAIAMMLPRKEGMPIVLIAALLGPGPVLELPYTWYLRRSGTLVVRASK